VSPKPTRRRSQPDDCRAVIALLTDYLEGGLAKSRLAALEAHLAGCGACAQYLESIRTTRAAVTRLRSDAMPEELRRRLRAFLRL